MKNLNSHPNLKIWTSLLVLTVLFLFSSSPIAQETDSTLTTTSKDGSILDKQLDELLTTTYCPCGCVRETNKKCVCETAQMIETMFLNRLSEGKTVEEIRTAYLEQYGSQFHAVMKAEGVNILAYVMPAVILIAIGGVIFGIRHRSRVNKGTSMPHEKQISDELQQHLESELEKYKIEIR